MGITINALKNFLHFSLATLAVNGNFQDPCLKIREKEHKKSKKEWEKGEEERKWGNSNMEIYTLYFRGCSEGSSAEAAAAATATATVEVMRERWVDERMNEEREKVKGGTERYKGRKSRGMNECEKRGERDEMDKAVLCTLFLLRESARECREKKCLLLRYYLKMTEAALFPRSSSSSSS